MKAGTLFLVRNLTADNPKFMKVGRKLYKTSVRLCSEQGVRFRVGTEYRNGRPVKMLTIMGATA